MMFNLNRCAVIIGLIVGAALLNAQADTLGTPSWTAQPKVTVEAAFSPEGDAEALIVKAIDEAQESIQVAAYSFTSPTIVKALTSAKRRGVDVRVVIDDKGNRGKANIAALNLLVMADIPVQKVSRYAIHHDKYMILDSKHVQTGSFNYSKAAAKSNSENVLVIRNDRGLAAAYLDHWQSRWELGRKVELSY